MSDDMRSSRENQVDSENGLSQNCPKAWLLGKKWGRSATPAPANTRARETLIICLIRLIRCESYFTSIILLVSV